MKTGIMHKKNVMERNVCTAGGAQRGAALIIALSVLLVLLSIAITFALMVRYESEMSQQGFQAARAENLLDGVLAKAMYRLNRDLETHPDALSLDHSWRTWFSGSAFVGKTWAREKMGVKSNTTLYFSEQGLVNINIKPVEDFLGHTLYVRFLKDNHIEPLFRGPRTESWLYVPRWQNDDILLYAESDEARLVQIDDTPAVTEINLVTLNDTLAGAGMPYRVHYFSKQPNDQRGVNFDPYTAYPFVTPAFYKDNTIWDDSEPDNYRGA